MANLNDLDHWWGNDLSVSATGDLQMTSGTTMGQQRVLRRLMTNPCTKTAPGDDIFHPDYGAGLPALVGTPISLDQLRALIRGQMLLESAVAKTPLPQIAVHPIDTGLSAQLSYTDSDSGQPSMLSFKVSS